ncbi:Uncharacterized protein TCM_012033 [Theobroma cacao]|uniref:R13L1/DRL21-like LRR repeat region domain-containing protein n=1 Tax=Theobroma cacao TaxID=3641 RepID=A0A061FTK3_THECC|nr:Uncharacterized protein TCM_012033 [Theobroma cacao]
MMIFGQLKKIILSNILKFACVTREMMMVELIIVKNLRINGCEELTSLWQSKWGWLAPLRSLHNLEFQNYPQVVCIGAAKEEAKEELLQLEIPCNIKHVRLEGFQGLERLSKSSHNLTCLTELEIVKCPNLVSLSVDNLPPNLRTLNIHNCENLQYLLDDIENIDFSSTSLLESLQVSACEALKSLSSSGQLPVGLKLLNIYLYPELAVLAQKIGDNTCLESLSLWDCRNIKYLLKGLDKLSCLQQIKFQDCPNLISFPKSGLPSANLKTLWLCGCEKLEALPNLHSLQQLFILACPRVQYSIREWGFLTNLTSLLMCEPKICVRQSWSGDCIDSPLLQPSTLMDRNESEIPVIDESTKPGHKGGMDLHHHAIELDIESWPVEHSMEQQDEDRPVKCQMPAYSSINVRYRVHLLEQWFRCDNS